MISIDAFNQMQTVQLRWIRIVLAYKVHVCSSASQKAYPRRFEIGPREFDSRDQKFFNRCTDVAYLAAKLKYNFV